MTSQDSSALTKVCPGCEAEYPATTQFFNSHPRMKHGVYNRCKACTAKPKNRQLAFARMQCPDGMRVCTRCLECKPADTSAFNRHSMGRDGFSASCRECYVQYMTAYRKANRESVRASQRKWEEANPEYAKEYYWRNREEQLKQAREYRQKNRNKLLAKAAAYRRANKEKAEATIIAWRRRNPQRVRSYAINYRARARSLKGRHDHLALQQMYEDQQGLCAYCEIPLFGCYEVDHMIPVSRGGGSGHGNLAVTCASCNRRKQNKTVEEFFDFLGWSVA